MSANCKVDQKPLSTQKEERLPHCQRCAQHKVRNRLRGHKSVCQFRDCSCAKCLIVVERQRLMADQIKLRRQQRKQRNIHKMQMELEQTNKQKDQKPDQKQVEQQHEQLVANLNFLADQQQYLSIFGLQSLFSQF
ncbi:CBR-DMD-3 protein [Aphelenchoides bicaudatus]|nr:CBR-DMD-3 protein [Aphelenchoides bicaudatus]